MTQTKTVLVLGATGKTGRRLVPRLVDAGATVRAASRRPSEGRVLFDWDDTATHGPALAGADAVFLVTPERVADPSPVVGPFLDRAAHAGVSQVVMLSQLLPDGDHPATSELGLPKVERLVMGSGLDWTIVRPTAFAQNFSEGWVLPSILHQDAVVAPTGDGTVAFVDADDIAAVAAAALVDDGHQKAAYAVTGPEAMTHAEAAATITEAAGRPIAHHDIPIEAFLENVQQYGIPADYAAMMAHFLTAIREGRMATVSDDVEQVTGRPPTRFADYARQAAAAWAVP
jgi:uncharacterized protein YbjT (DUF2867 family)